MPSIPTAFSTRRRVYLAALISLAVYAALGPTLHPAVTLGAPLRADLFLLVSLGFLAPWPNPVEERSMSLRHRMWVFPVMMGGLFGAAVVAPLVALPLLLFSGLWMAWALRGSGRRWMLGWREILLAALAASLNGTGVAVATAQGLRVSPERFVQEEFRVNHLLEDVPVHDVWAVDLRGPDSPTLEDLGRAFRGKTSLGLTPAIVGLGIIRGVAGGILGWDIPCWEDPANSFLNRLTEADREASSARPGATLGIWKVLYALPREGLVELQNATVHLAVAGAIGDGPEGAKLFLAFRVREINWTTWPYLKLIDPARRFFIYPFLLEQFAHTWERGEWTPPEPSFVGGTP